MLKSIAVFNSNHETLQAEKILKHNQLPFKPVIKPRKISSSCALALEFNSDFSKKISKLCIENKLSLIGIFKKSGEGWIET